MHSSRMHTVCCSGCVGGLPERADESPNSYLPQMKFVTVMFSQVSVCPQGGSRSLFRGFPPWGVSVQRRSLSRGGLCPEGSLSRGSLSRGCLSGGSVTETPHVVMSSSTHPTGMHSCVECKRSQGRRLASKHTSFKSQCICHTKSKVSLFFPKILFQKLEKSTCF